MTKNFRSVENAVLNREPLVREDFSRALHRYRDGSVVVLKREDGRVLTLPPSEAQKLGFKPPSKEAHR